MNLYADVKFINLATMSTDGEIIMSKAKWNQYEKHHETFTGTPELVYLKVSSYSHTVVQIGSDSLLFYAYKYSI